MMAPQLVARPTTDHEGRLADIRKAVESDNIGMARALLQGALAMYPQSEDLVRWAKVLEPPRVRTVARPRACMDAERARRLGLDRRTATTLALGCTRLRPPQAGDELLAAAINGDPVRSAMLFQGGPHSPARARDWLFGIQARDDCRVLTLLYRDTPAGFVWFENITSGTALGVLSTHPAAPVGLGVRAFLLGTVYAFLRERWTRLTIPVHVDNLPSIRLNEYFGGVREGTLREAWGLASVHLFGHLAGEARYLEVAF